MATKYQDNRSVKVTSPFGPNVLVFARMKSSERVSQPFHSEISLLSESGDLDPDRILGKPLVVALATQGTEPVRHFHGLVSEFEQVGYRERMHEYRCVTRPWFWFLTRTADCRIFQAMSVPDIFSEVCRQAGFRDVDLRLGSYEPREYCVQYRETDFDFLSRLLEHEGIFYFFEHSENKHVMVLADDVGKCKAIDGYDPVPFYPPTLSDALRERDHLERWSFQKSFQPGSFAGRDYDFERPTPIPEGAASISRAHDASKYEIYDFPAEPSKLTSSGVEQIAKLRVQALQTPQMIGRGGGDAAGLAAGHLFQLERHPRSSLNIRYLVTSTVISLSSDAYHAAAGSGETQFSIDVEAVDSREPYRPPRVTPRPMIHGAQTAVVVGPKGEEIHTDKWGRVKVQFHWDRYGKLDDKSSCFIRVGQLWAGKSWGGVHIPRIGQEVIVSFLEGDPDRPIVIGSVYNGANAPPYALPDERTRSGVRSRSSKGGSAENFNEIRFEDKKGSEEVFVQAEKDLNAVIKHDRSTSIGHDETLSVDHDRKTSISHDEQLSIGNDRETTVGKDEKRSVAQNRTTDVGGTEKLTIGKDSTTDVATKYVLTAGEQITLQTGASKLILKSDGSIELQGVSIKIEGSESIAAKAGQGVEVKGMQVNVSGTTVEVKGTKTSVEGTLVDVNATGIASLKGGLTKIG